MSVSIHVQPRIAARLRRFNACGACSVAQVGAKVLRLRNKKQRAVCLLSWFLFCCSAEMGMVRGDPSGKYYATSSTSGTYSFSSFTPWGMLFSFTFTS